MHTIRIPIQRLRPRASVDIPLPSFMTPLSAGMDICADIEAELVLMPQEIVAIPTGFAIALPEGYEAQIRPRSGLALKYGVTVVNAPGTIDADYRGEIRIALINLGKDPVTIHRGDRIGQMVVQRVIRVDWDEVGRLDDTVRGPGGFGHTGR
ncbi:dUTP diphosphatase [Desulfatirhabdium butyrativorans]|uniref:dUTP diphosphatase n=1 Tax=Desulfatirhabdium butyrativorans TaxID=340467 RepID=UPI000414CFBC|nr:dUTP diphosphatase [Desulfatirhabdium butyrativorans]